MCDIQELLELGALRELVKVLGVENPTNAGTKKLSYEDHPMHRLREVTRGRYVVKQ